MTARKFIPVAALTVHLVLAVFPYLASVLLAPVEGVIFLMVLWLALLGEGIWLGRHRPLWTTAVPVAAVVLWVMVIRAGDALLGWTA